MNYNINESNINVERELAIINSYELENRKNNLKLIAKNSNENMLSCLSGSVLNLRFNKHLNK